MQHIALGTGTALLGVWGDPGLRGAAYTLWLSGCHPTPVTSQSVTGLERVVRIEVMTAKCRQTD